MQERPQLSIIIASVNGRPYLDACLEALEAQESSLTAEVIVADCVGPDVTEFVESEFPHVRVLAFAEPRSVPELRSAGIRACKGEIIVITEDHCIPESDWYESILAAHTAAENPAIGGAVDNAATDRNIDWAVFFCEYSNFISPVDHGVVHDLPGPNVSYKRWSLDEMADLIRDSYWENFLHWRLEEKGYQLWSDPRVRVLHKKHYRFAEFMSERFHYGRAFAGTRVENSPVSRKLFYIVGSPLLPPMLIVRIFRRVYKRRRHMGAFLKALPVIGTFMLAWAAGEFVGYTSGPGESTLALR